MNKYALIAAGGSGSRMGSETPKQFIEIAGKTLLQHTMNAFEQAFGDIRFVLVFPETYMKKERQEFASSAHVMVVQGGETRFHSVQNGLDVIAGDDSIVFVHDAARCLVSPELIKRCYDAAVEKGSAIPVADVHDSLRLINEKGNTPLQRDKVKAVQTPQTFRLDILKKAFAQEYRDAFTDEATVAEAAGYTVHLVQGEPANIKLTTPIDLKLAELMLGTQGEPLQDQDTE